MSCGVGRRYSSDPMLLWLWPADVAPTLPPSLGLSISPGWGPKKKKKKKKFSKPYSLLPMYLYSRLLQINLEDITASEGSQSKVHIFLLPLEYGKVIPL